MDDERFDAVVQALGHGASRRGALGILVGLAGLGRGEAAAKRRRGAAQRGKRRSRGRVAAAAADKVAVCHYDADADAYVVIHVSRRGWDRGHSRHAGDFLRGGDDEGAVSCCDDRECRELSNECGAGVCDPETGTCAAPCGAGEQCIGNACVAVCDEPFIGNRPQACGCLTRVGADGFACLRATLCSPTCTSDAQCSGGAVCAFSPCCNLDEGVGVCHPRCAFPDDCTCASGREECNPSGWVTCGVNRV